MLDEQIVDPILLEQQIKKHEKSEVSEPLTYGINIYTDGGCEQKNTGWGVHGFVYANTPTKTGCGVSGYSATNLGYILNNNLMRINEVSDIFCENVVHRESCKIVQPFLYFDGSGSYQDGTNNIGETLAFMRALELIKRLYLEIPLTHVHFKIDSKYVINNVLTRFKLIANNYHNSGGIMKNLELWKEVYAKLEELSNLSIRWTVTWVEGHSDCFGNQQADRLATMGRIAAANGYLYDDMKFTPAQGRWGANSVDTKTNPGLYFMVDSKWYYDPQLVHETRKDDLVPLFLGNHEDHEHAGQPDAKTTASVVLLKNPPKHLNRLVEIASRLNNVENGYENVSAFHGTVNNIIRPEFEDQITKVSDRFLVTNENNKSILTFDNKEVLRSFNPPLMSQVMMGHFLDLHTVLDRVVSNELLNVDCLTDITHLFYSETLTGKNKKMLKVIAPNDAAIRVPVNYAIPGDNNVYQIKESQITLSYGITAPRHRVFGGVKDFDPKVYVLTIYEPVAGFRYYTVMHLSTGEWGIWTNPSANLSTIF